MKVVQTELPERADDRAAGASVTPAGFFFETFHAKRYAEAGITGPVRPGQPLALGARHAARACTSRSRTAQGKLVQVLRGRGVRRGGGRPPRLAHASAAGWAWSCREDTPRSCGSRRASPTASACSSESADFFYKCTELYAPECRAEHRLGRSGDRHHLAREGAAALGEGPRRAPARGGARCCPSSSVDVRELLPDWLLSPAYAPPARVPAAARRLPPETGQERPLPALAGRGAGFPTGGSSSGRWDGPAGSRSRSRERYGSPDRRCAGPAGSIPPAGGRVAGDRSPLRPRGPHCPPAAATRVESVSFRSSWTSWASSATTRAALAEGASTVLREVLRPADGWRRWLGVRPAGMDVPGKHGPRQLLTLARHVRDSLGRRASSGSAPVHCAPGCG